MLNTVTLEQAKHNIEQGINTCQKLLILLEQERDALKTRDTSALEEVIKQKSSNLLALEQGAKQRTAWVQADASQPPAEHEWAQHITQLNPELGRQWLQFKGLLSDCQIHNDVNGKMLARNQQVIKRLVSIVRGQTDSQPLYTPKGNRGAGKGYNKLGEA